MHLTKQITEGDFNEVSPMDYLKTLNLEPGMVVAFRFHCPDHTNPGQELFYENIAVVTTGRPLFFYKIMDSVSKLNTSISTKSNTYDRKFALRMSHVKKGKRYELPLMIDPVTGEMLNLLDMPYGYLVAVEGDTSELKSEINKLAAVELGREGRFYGEASIEELKPKPIEEFELAKARSASRSMVAAKN